MMLSKIDGPHEPFDTNGEIQLAERARAENETTRRLDVGGGGHAENVPGDALRPGGRFHAGGVNICHGPAEEFYNAWPEPVCIVSDGPYGVGGFPGDPRDARELPDWYRPHVAAWTERATPQTTLWFWNTELGWANVHPLLEEHGWEYRACHVWNKGIAHVAGNANSKTLRKLPVVTEVCVQYVKPARFEIDGEPASMQDWLRHEWQRSGIPFYRSNEACGVRNAASRKYLAPDHVWYYPPPDMFARLASYANEHGDPDGRPYFSTNGETPLSAQEWQKMRAKFDCPIGVTNVWDHPPVNGVARTSQPHSHPYCQRDTVNAKVARDAWQEAIDRSGDMCARPEPWQISFQYAEGTEALNYVTWSPSTGVVAPNENVVFIQAPRGYERL